MENMIYTESIRGVPYRSYKDTAKEFGLSEATVKMRVKEIREEIGKRYSEYALNEDGNIVRVNQLVFEDYMTYRQRLQNRNTRKYVPKFDPAAVAAYCGWSNRAIVDTEPDEIPEEVQEKLIEQISKKLEKNLKALLIKSLTGDEQAT